MVFCCRSLFAVTYAIKIQPKIADGNDRSLYPHAFDDLVFVIFQVEKLKVDAPHSSSEQVIQWFVFIFAASLILYALRTINRRLKQRMAHTTNSNAPSDYFLGSFIDSLAVFLGVGLDSLGRGRAERWFLISFSIFGLVVTIHYTDNLFVMLSTSESNRICSIDQLFRTHIPITYDMDAWSIPGMTKLDIRNKA